MNGPLASIRIGLHSLSSGVEMTGEVALAIVEFDRSVRDIERCLGRLTEIQHPSEWEV